MPLAALTKHLGLPNPVIRINEPYWLFAETVNLLGVTGLLVYRSTCIKDDDELYEDISDLISRHAAELRIHKQVRDEDMVWGIGEWLWYVLKDTAETLIPDDPRVHKFLDFVQSYDNHPVLPRHVAKVTYRKLLALVS